MNRSTRSPDLRHLLFVVGFGVAGAMGIAPLQAQNMCGGTTYPFPYTDVASVGAAFCPGIMEAYVTGVSKGTTPTTFSPTETVTRVQMTTFLQRSLDQGLARTGRRAALNQWWTPHISSMQPIIVGGAPQFCAADGADIWTTNGLQVVQVQANTGKELGNWGGATLSYGLVVANNKIFVAGGTNPGSLYEIDPSQSPGTVTTVASTLGNSPVGIAFDGSFLWTANHADGVSGGSVSGIDTQSPYAVFTAAAGFAAPTGILYDGSNIWVTDSAAGMLFKLDLGSIVQSVNTGAGPGYPVFDGANIWVPNVDDNSITVVQASTGSVVATIASNASNQLNSPTAASFDGERILVTNFGNNTVTVFKAADLSFIVNVSTGVGSRPLTACSDGVNFWVTLLTGAGNLLRF